VVPEVPLVRKKTTMKHFEVSFTQKGGEWKTFSAIRASSVRVAINRALKGERVGSVVHVKAAEVFVAEKK
jgi:hypothetical protein